MLISLVMSGGLAATVSDEPFCEGDGLIEIVEIAESIEDVRGIFPASARRLEAAKGGDTIVRGEGGEELPDGLRLGRGVEAIRSWLYDCALEGEALASLKASPRAVAVSLFAVEVPEARNSSIRSRGDLGGSKLATTCDRGDRGEYCAVSLADLKTADDLGLLLCGDMSPPAAIAGVWLTCSGVGLCDAFRPSPGRA